MTYALVSTTIQCPYCWEYFETTIDQSEVMDGASSRYTEDCYVCCRPIVINISQYDNGETACLVEAELE